jgi:hypothetical protein
MSHEAMRTPELTAAVDRAAPQPTPEADLPDEE